VRNILFVSDGIIVLVDAALEIPEAEVKDASIVVTDYGAELMVRNIPICLPVSVLEHLEQAEGTNIYFYESDPYALVAPYRGNVVLNRDEILKVKGAWEYQVSSQRS
jgi:hypothetical protein